MTDAGLIEIVDAAMAEAVRRSGRWVACQPGCTPCCIGVFPISAADAVRLRRGMDALDAATQARVRQRARASVERLIPGFPGDPATGILGETSQDEAAFEDFGNDEPCPALDPATGRCDLYEFRPMTCRTFGPAVRLSGGPVGACELCYQGATEQEVVECAVDIDLAGTDSGPQTLVAFAIY
jgi:Fe-S-cluster containining protein